MISYLKLTARRNYDIFNCNTVSQLCEYQASFGVYFKYTLK